jgi:hypothetical protein
MSGFTHETRLLLTTKSEHWVNMEDDFIYQIQLKETPDNILYKWSLCEKNSEGLQVVSDVIPFFYNLKFTASNLNVRTTFSNYSSSDVGGQKISEIIISGEMKSGVIRANHTVSDVVQYSLLGTNRKINSFDFNIQQTEFDTDTDQCSLYAQIEHEYEVSFRHTQVPDRLLFEIRFSKNRFQELLKLIQTDEIDCMYFNVSGVEGFYSEWSPSIYPHVIKVLTSDDKQIIDSPSDTKIIPKRTGVVHEFSISCNSSRTYFTDESVDNAMWKKSKQDEPKWMSTEVDVINLDSQASNNTSKDLYENQPKENLSIWTRLFK